MRRRGGVPSSVEKRSGAFFRLVKCTTSRPPWQAATGGTRHGEAYQQVRWNAPSTPIDKDGTFWYRIASSSVRATDRSAHDARERSGAGTASVLTDPPTERNLRGIRAETRALRS